MAKKQTDSTIVSKKVKNRTILLLWSLFISPFFVIAIIMLFISESSLPSIDELENPRSNEASAVYSSDGNQIGSFYISNRTKVDYNDLSPSSC